MQALLLHARDLERGHPSLRRSLVHRPELPAPRKRRRGHPQFPRDLDPHGPLARIAVRARLSPLTRLGEAFTPPCKRGWSRTCYTFWHSNIEGVSMNQLPSRNIFAYIDASNLKFGVAQGGWNLDYRKFRSWLRDKFGITQAFMFMGFKSGNVALYEELEGLGFSIIFRSTITGSNGITKGNVDGELILRTCRDFFEEDLASAVLVSGDGDYHCIVEFLKEKNIPVTIVSPNRKYLSLLLKRTNVPIVILDEFVLKLAVDTPYMKRPPGMP